MQRLFRAALIALAVAVTFAPNIAEAIDVTWPSDTAPRQISVTKDSAPGWLPTGNQIAEMRKATNDYFAAKDDGRSADAYGFLTEVNKQNQSLHGFADRLSKFNLLAGPIKTRRVVMVTWTKDPAQASAPGVYAALDLVSLFANIDRHCGYLILYQPPTGGAFAVMREENNFLDNTSAQKIEQQRSRADLDRAWAQLSAHCPNHSAEPTPLPEKSGSTVGYPTVDDALKGLHANPSVEFSAKTGWTIAIDKTALTVWSFVPIGDPAYPAVVKRHVI